MAKLEGMTAITIEAWGRPRNLTGQEGLSVASKRNTTNAEDSYNLFVYSGQDVHGRINGNSGGEVLSTTILQDDTWYHLALVFDGQAAGDNMFLYVNGVLVDEDNLTGDLAQQPTSMLYIGSDDSGFLSVAAPEIDGYIDEFAMYARELSAAEIMAHYEGSRP